MNVISRYLCEYWGDGARGGYHDAFLRLAEAGSEPKARVYKQQAWQLWSSLLASSCWYDIWLLIQLHLEEKVSSRNSYIDCNPRRKINGERGIAVETFTN